MGTVEQEAHEVADLVAVQEAMAAFATESLLLVRPDGEIVAADIHGTGLLGYPKDEQTGIHITTRVHPDDLARALDLIGRVRDSDAPVDQTISVRVRHHDGRWCPLWVDILDQRDHPDLAGIVLRLRLPERGGEPVQEPLLDPHDHLRSLADAVPSGIVAADAWGQVVFSNRAAQEIFDVPASELVGTSWVEVIDARDRPDVAAASGSVLSSSHKEQTSFRVHCRTGMRWVHATFVPLRSDGASSGWIATLEDVTERRRAEADLAHRASHDVLTGLPNRMLVIDRLTQASARLRRDPQPLTVLFVDLDGFKGINDRMGHSTGDRILVEAGRRLRTAVRPADTVGRLGGDEFVAVCEGMPAAEARAMAARLADAVAVPMLVDGGTAEVGVSVGVWTTFDATLAAEDLLARADRDMYRQKRATAG
jgi:diguanylate cyclase (GGDEF)-like protein/PAS domain S-box-containing protein